MNLIICLTFQVGVLKAIHLAREHNLRFLPVHHMEAHALIARQAAHVPFPFVCLLVSGGHNMLLLAHGLGNYTLLGSTLDDAVGEGFTPLACMQAMCEIPFGMSEMDVEVCMPHSFHELFGHGF